MTYSQSPALKNKKVQARKKVLPLKNKKNRGTEINNTIKGTDPLLPPLQRKKEFHSVANPFGTL